MFELSKADIKSYGVLYERPDILESYKERVNKMLEDVGWKQNSKIAEILHMDAAYFSINGLIIELPLMRQTYHNVYTYAGKLRMPIFNFLDEIMPLQMLGVVEIKVSWRDEKNNRWDGEVKVRW